MQTLYAKCAQLKFDIGLLVGSILFQISLWRDRGQGAQSFPASWIYWRNCWGAETCVASFRHVVLQVGHLFRSVAFSYIRHTSICTMGVTTAQCQDLLPAWATALESEDRQAANCDASLSRGRGTFPPLRTLLQKHGNEWKWKKVNFGIALRTSGGTTDAVRLACHTWSCNHCHSAEWNTWCQIFLVQLAGMKRRWLQLSTSGWQLGGFRSRTDSYTSVAHTCCQMPVYIYHITSSITSIVELL